LDAFVCSYADGEIGFKAGDVDLAKVIGTIRLLQTALKSKGADVDLESEIPVVHKKQWIS
jgi:hypothetical protein